MGMFNTILADLMCPKREDVAKNAEIQIKWQEQGFRTLNVYRLGDLLEHIEEAYHDTWVRTDYVCKACSKYTTGRNGMRYIKTEDQSRHLVFVKIEDERLSAIVSEEAFEKLGSETCVDDF